MGLTLAIIGTTFWLGMRHGLDTDHLSAIADITAQDSRKKALTGSFMYSIGHAAANLLLGAGALALGLTIPQSMSTAVGKIVGITLIVLALVVAYSLWQQWGKDELKLKNRWVLLIDMFRQFLPHKHQHGSSATRERTVLGAGTCFSIGTIHGIGVESPTQILAIAAATGSGKATAGIIVLLAFVAGMLISNSLFAILTVLGFQNAKRRHVVYVTVSVITSLLGLCVGIQCLFG